MLKGAVIGPMVLGGVELHGDGRGEDGLVVGEEGVVVSGEFEGLLLGRYG